MAQRSWDTTEFDEDETSVFAYNNLPNDLLETILGCLPFKSIARGKCVCRRWHTTVNSKPFKWIMSNVLTQKPWYFMFITSSKTSKTICYAYDPNLKIWYYKLKLPLVIRSGSNNFSTASSCGMLCFQDNDNRGKLWISNPVANTFREIKEPKGFYKFEGYSALALSVNRESNCYKVLIVKSSPMPVPDGHFSQYEISIHIYNSERLKWNLSLAEILEGWRGGEESVICNGVLHFLVFSLGALDEYQHALITYDISSPSSLRSGFIEIPFTLTCGRVLNMNESLVLVGGIGMPDQRDILIGIGIWVLDGTTWEEITRMPDNFLRSFDINDYAFASRGADDLIYIHSYDAARLAIFNMSNREWHWSPTCLVPKRDDPHFLASFSTEPRLEMEP